MIKGTHLSKESKQKMSLAHKGQLPWNTGKLLSEEHKRKLSDGHKGNKSIRGQHRSEETKRKISEAKKGRQVSKETRLKLSETHKGNKSSFWRGGIAPMNKIIRMGIEYRLWKESVFARDNWTCQECEKRGVRLNAHHIKSFAKYPELRFAIDNGVTLCHKCHKETESFGSKNNENGKNKC